MEDNQPKTQKVFRMRLTAALRKNVWQAPKENAGAGWNTGGDVVAAGSEFEALDSFGCYQKRRTEIE